MTAPNPSVFVHEPEVAGDDRHDCRRCTAIHPIPGGADG